MLKFLVPPFIKNLDKILVLNYPFWYVVKMHYIAWFTVLMWLLSYFIGNILTIDISVHNPETVTGTWTFLFSVLGIILFCVWMYYLTIYNAEDRYGKYSVWDDTKLLCVLLVGINMLMSFSYPMQLRVKSRLANTFDDASLAQQFNALNLANKYMTSEIESFQYCGYGLHDKVDHKTLINDTVAFMNHMPVYDLNKYNDFLHFTPQTSQRFRYDISSILFVTKVNSSGSVFNNMLLNETQIELEYKKHITDADRLNAITNYFKVADLYKGKYSDNIYGMQDSRYTPQDYLDNYNHIEKTCTTYFPVAFNVKESGINGDHLPKKDASSFIMNIYDAKFELPHILSPGYLLFAFYFSFFISICIILFRNNRWQHFLISVVAYILIGIIVGIISLMVGSSSGGALFSTISFILWIIAGGISIAYYFKKDKYNTVSAVATILFYVALPFAPFFFCMYLHETFAWLKCYPDDYANVALNIQCEIEKRTYNDVLIYAQLIGIAGFIFIAMPFYKVFFAGQKALPREK